MTANYSQNLNTLTILNGRISQIGLASALYAAQTAYQNATYEFQGLIAQMQIQTMAVFADAQNDFAGLAANSAAGIANKATEMSLFIGQYREKMVNMFIQMQDAKDANSWNRLKQLAGGMKYAFFIFIFKKLWLVSLFF